MTDASMKRWVSIFEIYGTPEGKRARLGTGTYEEVFSREVSMPRIGCLFSHATDEYRRADRDRSVQVINFIGVRNVLGWVTTAQIRSLDIS